MGSEEFPLIYEKMKAILQPYAPYLRVREETPADFYLETEYSERWKKPVFFGSAAVKKNYVSFYLMPVYMYPELLEGISPELKKRMQGKSCFNLKSADAALLEELERLTRRGFEKFKAEGLVK
jgi:hypothetical protein